MNKTKVNSMNTTVLAYIGDGVYELAIRKYIVAKGSPHIHGIHKEAVKYVNGASQAKVLKSIFETLSAEEASLAKRARNRKTLSKPKNLDPVTYKLATAFEALIGYLYMLENHERIDEIVKAAIEIVERDNHGK